MDKFLEKYNLPKLNQEKAESLNRLVTASEIEAVIKKILAHKSSINSRWMYKQGIFRGMARVNSAEVTGVGQALDGAGEGHGTQA